MAENKVFAGLAVRRLRRARGLTQAAMADVLGISPSYLTLVEGNQRPLTASLMLRLGEAFDFDPRQLAASEPGGGTDALRRRLGDPLFADLGIDRARLDDWLAAAPEGAEAFARAFDRAGTSAGAVNDPIGPVRREIERWRNHFPDLEALAERLSDELRLGSGELYGAIAERLRVKHQLSIRILPVDVMPATLRRLDLHARQLQLSELLDPASRTFAAAFQLGQIEAKDEIEALIKGGGFAAQDSGRVPERLYRRHLASQFAAALMMPYDRFLRACETTGYDIELLQRRFGAGFEQVTHRLTTLSRTGARGLPFFMLRIDRAGQVSKRYAGASGSPLVEAEGRCPLWALHAAFDRPGVLVRQLIALEDETRWFTQARTVNPQGGRIGQVRAQFAIGLGLDAALAGPLAAARGIDLGGTAMPIGLGCRQCTRPDCPQRAAPPMARTLVFNERERGLSPFVFAGD
jgi:XRE family transcriptional regulator, fatty acid utilization regulator